MSLRRFCIFCQSADLPPPAAHAQTWKQRIANTKPLVAKTAAVAGVLVQLGSTLLVSKIQPLENNYGSQ